MGVYYYTLGKTGRVKAVVNGETKTLFPFAYRWKFYGSAFGPCLLYTSDAADD